MIDGFECIRVDCGDISLSVHRAGQGEPLLLLHGYPQNHHCWGKVAPQFAQNFDVIVPDLRGYGDSDAPPDDELHTVYAKRTMANDIAHLMDKLGIAQAHILGHDRGGRVAYRFALDHPERVKKLGIIEIVPTGDFWAHWNADLALKGYHWTFLAQPYPLPERMIGADPAAYIEWTLAAWTLSKSLDVFSPEALQSYCAQAADPAHLHAMCADYRAGATYDRRLDEAETGRISAPLHFLWAESGFPAHTGDPSAIWRKWATYVSDTSCISGHFAMEENPQAVLDAFIPFFTAG
ncbi:haloacetate dehalogenase [Cognatiyoonia koreensis]|uniref:Haloacetate dehalogenase n=1 Tax=Cognatiyoonia koreensis TaxID=364200 RepID=A0A1I0RV52_9RHOB|nr:alpha/beta hydrolase [Cognatiyoonia koreensis]SEW45177.1 haloacetate dehalogenase [Cognatiyoonia koreensis]